MTTTSRSARHAGRGVRIPRPERRREGPRQWRSWRTTGSARAGNWTETLDADLPSYVWLLLLIGVIGTRTTVCVNLYQGAVAATGNRSQARRVAWVAAGALFGWLVIDGLLAWTGVYRHAPLFVLVVVVVFVATLLAARTPQIARILAEPSMAPRLIQPEAFRSVGAVFLVVLALGKLPTAFAWLAGFGDIATGLAAPFIATRLRRRPDWRTGVVVYNAFGLLDFVAASSRRT